MGGKGEMIKAPISLHDLRRKLYRKAKAEPSWRFWGLYVHICKPERPSVKKYAKIQVERLKVPKLVKARAFYALILA
jgi:hypothetical protein